MFAKLKQKTLEDKAKSPAPKDEVKRTENQPGVSILAGVSFI